MHDLREVVDVVEIGVHKDEADTMTRLVRTTDTRHASVAVFNFNDDMASAAARPTSMESRPTMSWRQPTIRRVYQ